MASTKVKSEDIETNVTAEASADEGYETVTLKKDKEHLLPQYVCINGKGYMIERGKDVKVPSAVAEVLRNQANMQSLALDRSLELQEQAKRF